MRKVFPNENPPYDDDRRISNARFDYKPGVICYCYNPQDVVDALNFARDYAGVRVRAGGHHHEGMCSGNNVAMIDVSNLNRIDVDLATQTVRVGPGAKLVDVYNTVLKEGYLFPGGACGDVHAGGLVQGGGWGLYTRGLGLTCDAVEEFTIVLPMVTNGKVVDFYLQRVRGNAEISDNDLYWAVCGGGGGNFGVPIDFTFRIVPYRYSPGPSPKHVTQFTANWKDRSLVPEVIDGWMKKFPSSSDERLTSFCRVIARGTENLRDQPSLVLGNFVGEKAELEQILDEMLPRRSDADVHCEEIAVWPPAPSPARALFTHPQYQPGAPGGLTDTCASGAYFRHKVSSAFPRLSADPRVPPLGPEAMNVIVKHISDVPPRSNARRYLSLHSLGGVAANREREQWNCFAYRDKPFILQYQAWWEDQSADTENLDWVKNFRDEMRPFVDGSFINFPDRELVDTKDQKTLMHPYYGKHFTRLMAIKNRYDPTGFFDFPMGIPRS